MEPCTCGSGLPGQWQLCRWEIPMFITCKECHGRKMREYEYEKAHSRVEYPTCWDNKPIKGITR